MNRYDEINSIFAEFPDYLKNKNVYESMINSANEDKERGYTFSQLLRFFISDILTKHGLSEEDFKNQSKGRKVRAITYIRAWMVMFLREKGYTLPEISKMLDISWHIVRRCYLDFDMLMDDERFEIGYNKFIVTSRKYF